MFQITKECTVRVETNEQRIRDLKRLRRTMAGDPRATKNLIEQIKAIRSNQASKIHLSSPELNEVRNSLYLAEMMIMMHEAVMPNEIVEEPLATAVPLSNVITGPSTELPTDAIQQIDSILNSTLAFDQERFAADDSADNENDAIQLIYNPSVPEVEESEDDQNDAILWIYNPSGEMRDGQQSDIIPETVPKDDDSEAGA